jgi:hypothetical protein
MSRHIIQRTWPLLLTGLMIGCGTPTASAPGKDKDDAAVKAAFESLQAALLAKDGDKIWGMLDKESQDDAGRAAKAWQEAFAKEDADKVKAKLGVSADELAKLTGKDYLKTPAFLSGKPIDEIGPGKLDHVEVKGDQATAHYIEPDGDKEKLTYTRKDGQWKVSLKMPMPKKS